MTFPWAAACLDARDRPRPRGMIRMRHGEPDLDRGAVLFLFRAAAGRITADRITGLTAPTQRVQNLQLTRRGSERLRWAGPAAMHNVVA